MDIAAPVVAVPRGVAVVAAVTVAVALGGCSIEVDDGASTPAAPAGSSSSESQSAAAASASAAPSGSYAVIETDESTGKPVTYSSCLPIPYVTHLDGSPKEVDTLVQQAVQRVAEATGLRFVDEGHTSERADPDRDAVVARYDEDRWAPVLIVWSDPDRVPDLDGDTAAIGGSIPVSDAAGRTAYVSGDVVLDGPDLEDMLDEEGAGPDLVRAVVEHELAHLVGLDHVDDDTQLMYAEATGKVLDFQAGDLAGLAAMGQGPCITDLATPDE